MKEFNLEKALAGDPVVTRDGRPVKIAGYNSDAIDGQKIVGWVEKECWYWYSDGSFMRTEQRGKDLFMAPTERKEWIVIVRSYRYGKESFAKAEGPFKTYEHAIHCQKQWDYATIHEITITE